MSFPITQVLIYNIDTKKFFRVNATNQFVERIHLFINRSPIYMLEDEYPVDGEVYDKFWYDKDSEEQRHSREFIEAMRRAKAL